MYKITNVNVVQPTGAKLRPAPNSSSLAKKRTNDVEGEFK